MSTGFRRHDLVWIDTRTSPDLLECSGEDSLFVNEWVQARRPVVVTRRGPCDAEGGALRVGITLPRRELRRRIAFRVPIEAIARHEAPPLLVDAIRAAPSDWQPKANRLLRASIEASFEIRVYGSLAAQHFSNADHLHPSSDLDLLVELEHSSRAAAVVRVLESLESDAPRLDGEIRLANGWAVAWRELAAVLRAPDISSIVAKADLGVALLSVHEALQPIPDAT